MPSTASRSQREPTSEHTRLTRCAKRAWIHGGPQAAEPIGPDRYRVTASDGRKTYTVQVRSAERMACTCDAGMHSVPCWHVAVVGLRRIADGLA